MANYPKTRKKERTKLDDIKTGLYHLHYDKGSNTYTYSTLRGRYGVYLTATFQAKSRKAAEQLVDIMIGMGSL